MVLEYFSSKKGKKTAPAAPVGDSKSPVINKEDEAFLRRITSEDQLPPQPAEPVVILDNGKEVKGKDAQEALMDGAHQIPLPTSPPAVEEEPVTAVKDKKKKKAYLSYIQSRVSALPFGKDHKRNQAATDLQAVATAVKSGDTAEGVVSPEEAEKEKKDMTSILDQLNLSAVNNQVFSFSKESQRLMDEFTQILKDLVNGVPTAYDDLEKFLTRSETEVSGMFDKMPPFLQNLVKSLPAKMTSTIAPGLLAASSEKPGADMAAMSGGTASKAKRTIPSLKKLIAQQGAVTGMLRTILNFLKLRFPTFLTGTNVLLSLAVFLLLFVFWYCHKRGKETRLAKEALAAEGAHLGVDDTSDVEGSVILDAKEDEQIRAAIAAAETPDPETVRLEAILNQPSTASQAKSEEKVLASK